MAEQVPLSGIRAVVFDKDGTLIDVHRTWGPAMAGALLDLVDDPTRRSEAAAAIGVDLDTHELSVDAPIIAASNDQIVAILAPILDVDPERFLPIFEERLFAHADGTVTPLSGVSDALDALASMGCWIGLATNDAEMSASAAHRAWVAASVRERDRLRLRLRRQARFGDAARKRRAGWRQTAGTRARRRHRHGSAHGCSSGLPECLGPCAGRFDPANGAPGVVGRVAALLA